MPDVQHDYRQWAERRGGQDDGAAPAAQETQDGGGGDGGDGGDGSDGGIGAGMTAGECVRHAAEEAGEAAEYLKAARDKLAEPEDVDEQVDALEESQQALTELADQIDAEGDEEDDDEDGEDAGGGGGG